MTTSERLPGTEARARETHGASTAAVYRLVADALASAGVTAGTLVDVGCGRGELRDWVRERSTRYVGVDVVRHAGFPADAELVLMDLDRGRVPLADGSAEVVVSAETIEHVENPRALVRDLVRLARPGGLVLVTTPNQLSLASLLCLAKRGQFQYFQEGPGLYPAHISALLPIDLERIFTECGLERVELLYSADGRVPFSERRWPARWVARRGARGRLLSDNVLVRGRKPGGP